MKEGVKMLKEIGTKSIPYMQMNAKTVRNCEICGEATELLDKHICENCRKALHILITEEALKKDTDAVEMAMDALKRQIPKKPIKETKDYVVPYYFCSSCGVFITNDYEGKKYDHAFCSCCGQRIDWTGGEAIVMQNLPTEKVDYCIRCGQRIDKELEREVTA